jgi:hypothetical protein
MCWNDEDQIANWYIEHTTSSAAANKLFRNWMIVTVSKFAFSCTVCRNLQRMVNTIGIDYLKSEKVCPNCLAG